MLKIALKYSLVAGLSLLTLFYISIWADVNPFLDLRQLIFDLLVVGVFIFFSCTEYKNGNQAVLHFWQGMSIGMMVSAFSGLIFIFVLTIHFEMDLSLLEEYKTGALDFLIVRKDAFIDQFGAEAFEAEKLMIQETSAFELLFNAWIKKLMAGFFVTPVISIILRGKPKNN